MGVIGVRFQSLQANEANNPNKSRAQLAGQEAEAQGAIPGQIASAGENLAGSGQAAGVLPDRLTGFANGGIAGLISPRKRKLVPFAKVGVPEPPKPPERGVVR